MFDDLHTIDWESLRVPDAPKWIRGLISEDIPLRDESLIICETRISMNDPSWHSMSFFT
ncbi:MAG: hypothetical protein ACPG7F_08970 [Aggregatilineales bacterium]